MSAPDPDTDRLIEITRRAAAIASHAPEHLQEAAFNRAFDQLSGGSRSGGEGGGAGSGGSTSATRSRSAGTSRKRSTAPTDHDDAENDPASVLISAMSRTDHPEITSATLALDKAMHLLRVAESEHGIEGMTAPAIAKVLTDKFRWRVTPQAIRQALDRAGNFVDRVPQKKGTTYRVMQPGENYLDAGGAATQEQGTTASSRSRRQATSRRRAKLKAAPKKSEGTTSTATTARKRSGRGPKGLVEELISEGFFAQPRTIGAIQERLRHKKGVQLKATDLSPTLVRLLREKTLDRERNDSNQYEYSVPS